jgi:hypothetical protein
LLQASIKGPGNSGAFIVFRSIQNGVDMRKPAAVSVAARTASFLTGGADEAPANLVCLALALALLALVARIASIW